MMKIKERYFIKIVPHRGDMVHRFEVTRGHIVMASTILAAALLGSLAVGLAQLIHTHAQVADLQTLASRQREQLQTIDRKTSTIRTQIRSVQKQNQEIQQLIGVRTKRAAPAGPQRSVVQKTSWVTPALGRVDALAAASAQTMQESNTLRRLALRVLNLHHVEELARARTIAAIPSIDPVEGAQVVGCFCYRSYPDSEFHAGVDLGANYGEVVHATAAGTIASAAWDGGYGLKVDIDHGNGYHTWYAHLSRSDVQAGRYVYKGEAIGLVGDTGFSTGPHLHYQVMVNGSAIDPQPYLGGVPPKVLASLP